jgi:hypothetical protein
MTYVSFQISRLIRCLLLIIAIDGVLMPPSFGDAPAVTSLIPAGAQVGQTVKVHIHGKPGTAPVQVWSDRPEVTVTPGEKPEEFSVAVSAEAKPGLAWLRWHNAEGASEPRPFWIGSIAELAEVEPNNAADKATPIDSTPVIVNAALSKAGEVDLFRVNLEAGQTLVASLEANRSLPSPMDGVLQILGPTGFVVQQNDDDHGNDSLIAWTAKSSGPHYVRVFAFPAQTDASIRLAGGENYIYRLAVTTGPFVEHLEPLLEPQGSVRLHGWNIPESQAVTNLPSPVVLPAGMPTSLRLDTLPRLDGMLLLDQEPDDATKERVVPVPSVVSGRFDGSGDRDSFRFEGKAKQSIHLEAYAELIGSLADVVLVLKGPDGKVLKEADDADKGNSDPAFDQILPADGVYTAEVFERFSHGSPRCFYLLNITPTQPEVELRITANRYTIAAGKTLEIPITITRRNGMTERIAFAPEMLPPGITAEAIESPGEGDASKSVKLKLTAAADAAPASVPLKLIATFVGSMRTPEPVRAPIEGLKDTTASLWLNVTK